MVDPIVWTQVCIQAEGFKVAYPPTDRPLVSPSAPSPGHLQSNTGLCVNLCSDCAAHCCYGSIRFKALCALGRREAQTVPARELVVGTAARDRSVGLARGRTERSIGSDCLGLGARLAGSSACNGRGGTGCGLAFSRPTVPCGSRLPVADANGTSGNTITSLFCSAALRSLSSLHHSQTCISDTLVHASSHPWFLEPSRALFHTRSHVSHMLQRCPHPVLAPGAPALIISIRSAAQQSALVRRTRQSQ
ncbi:hypothetical protein K461DRAFT_146365 [Myriangium duriaei CBS 260.36]|uniref:Uncharacterized protein n=1 Tax=Myriangium duriaei CBS 260.36 TaxID=1168546 RepID=A0A9P4MGQ2_9PEZI|nr:hypothetical protein K461DRAFT_146365 [Myriangium duriaei CBS 260.36]